MDRKIWIRWKHDISKPPIIITNYVIHFVRRKPFHHLCMPFYYTFFIRLHFICFFTSTSSRSFARLFVSSNHYFDISHIFHPKNWNLSSKILFIYLHIPNNSEWNCQENFSKKIYFSKFNKTPNCRKILSSNRWICSDQAQRKHWLTN